MWERNLIPGYAEAENSERVDRALPFIGLPEIISGRTVEPYTPRRNEILRAYSNPIIVGGRRAEVTDIEQFLWVVSPEFKMFDTVARDAFVQSLDVETFKTVDEEIEEYLDRAFLDAPHGPADKGHYSVAAYHIWAMSAEPFRWDMERTLDTPFPILFQLQKCKAKHEGCTVVNRRSDGAAGDWLDTLQVITEPTEEKLKKRIDQLRAEGMEIVSNMSPNMGEVKSAEGVVTRGVVSYSVAMMRVKGGHDNGE